MSSTNSTLHLNKYSVSHSISAVVWVFGEHANNYKIFRTETKQPAQTLLSYLSAERYTLISYLGPADQLAFDRFSPLG